MSTIAIAENPYEQQARARKVDALAEYLTRSRPPAEVLEFAGRMDLRWWDRMAEAAGVNPPSERARAQVIERLRELERLDASDPYEGL